MEESWKFPWPEPIGCYNSDGPRTKDPVEFDMDGHRFLVQATGDSGCDTGRARYRVMCLTCRVLIHWNTTGPSSRCKSHLMHPDECNAGTDIRKQSPCPKCGFEWVAKAESCKYHCIGCNECDGII